MVILRFPMVISRLVSPVRTELRFGPMVDGVAREIRLGKGGQNLSTKTTRVFPGKGSLGLGQYRCRCIINNRLRASEDARLYVYARGHFVVNTKLLETKFEWVDRSYGATDMMASSSFRVHPKGSYENVKKRRLDRSFVGSCCPLSDTFEIDWDCEISAVNGNDWADDRFSDDELESLFHAPIEDFPSKKRRMESAINARTSVHTTLEAIELASQPTGPDGGVMFKEIQPIPFEYCMPTSHSPGVASYQWSSTKNFSTDSFSKIAPVLSSCRDWAGATPEKQPHTDSTLNGNPPKACAGVLSDIGIYISAQDRRSVEEVPDDMVLPKETFTRNIEGAYVAGMAAPGDLSALTPYQSLVRQSVEYFTAIDDDVNTTIQGRRQPVRPQQLGIRCRYCSHLPVAARQRAAVYYPRSLMNVYQGAQNIASVHFQQCAEFPKNLLGRLAYEKPMRKFSVAGKPYWLRTCLALGVYEADGALWVQLP